MIRLKLPCLLKKHAKMAISLSLMLSLGITLLVALTSAFSSFNDSVEEYFDQYAFADLTVFIQPTNTIPETPERAASMASQSVYDCPVFSDDDWLAEARCSFADGETLERRYQVLDSVAPSESMVNVGIDVCFLENAGINLGDTLTIRSSYGSFEAYVSEEVTSPDNFAIARNSFNTYDSSSFGYLYIDIDELAEHLAVPARSYNQLLVYTDDAEGALEQIGEENAVLSSYDAADSPQKEAVYDNIRPMRILSYVLPPLIFLITFSITWLFIMQIVQEERRDIGLLRALGYSSESIVGLFAAFGLVISTAASLLGSLGGYFASSLIADQYFNAYYMPVRIIAQQPFAYLFSIALVFLLGQMATIIAVMRIARIDPADALRSGARRLAVRPVAIQINGVPELVRSQIRFSLRNRKRTLMTIVSVALTGIVMCFATAYSSAIDAILSETLQTRYRYDAVVQLDQSLSPSDWRARFTNVAEIDDCEPATFCDVKIAFNGADMDVLLFAISPDSDMIALEDRSGGGVDVPEDGIVLEYHAARDLGIEVGDTVEVDGVPVSVTGISYQDMKYTQYVSLAQMEKLRGSSMVDCALVRFSEGVTDQHFRDVASEMDGFEYVSFTESVRKGITVYVNNGIAGVVALLVGGFAIGFLIVYNMALINFNERKRDFSVLMVQGVSRFRVATGVFAELFIEYLPSMALVALIGIPIANALLDVCEVKYMSFRNIHPMMTLLSNALFVFAYVAFSNGLAMLKLRRVDLADSLKEGE